VRGGSNPALFFYDFGLAGLAAGLAAGAEILPDCSAIFSARDTRAGPHRAVHASFDLGTEGKTAPFMVQLFGLSAEAVNRAVAMEDRAVESIPAGRKPTHGVSTRHTNTLGVNGTSHWSSLFCRIEVVRSGCEQCCIRWRRWFA
jgi:hypothetical protein